MKNKQYHMNIDFSIREPFKNIPFCNATVDSLVSIEYNIPSYRISLLDIKLILLPIYGIPEKSRIILFLVCLGVKYGGGWV